jgi:hypothetical protein
MTPPDGPKPDGMTVDVRRTIASVIEIWNGATADGLDRLLAPGYRGHMLGTAAGDRVAAGYADAVARFRIANPGVAFRAIEQFDAGDRCVTRLEATRPANGSNRPSVSHGINISRFDRNGRLAEEWAIWSPWLDAASQTDDDDGP